ncbi:MAG: MFS transporter [Dehalococcoidia bacterium]|nr:MFS transporter [Dehalococcoidia bacterium]
MISQLETRGFEAGAVAGAIAITGLVSLPGRLLLPSLAARISSAVMLAVCLGGLALSALVASIAGDWWQVWVYVGVFGLVFGAVYPLRTLVLSEQFDGVYFGRVIGLQAMMIAGARALGPVAIGLPGTDTETYSWSFRVAALVLAMAAAVTVFSGRRRRARPEEPG